MTEKTQIICGVLSCKHLTPKGHFAGGFGVCGKETIHLQPCSPDADNFVGCSEFEETKARKRQQKGGKR